MFVDVHLRKKKKKNICDRNNTFNGQKLLFMFRSEKKADENIEVKL